MATKRGATKQPSRKRTASSPAPADPTEGPILSPRTSKVPAQDSAFLTSPMGQRLPHTDDSLTVSGRGPTLMEDFHLREKIMHFDHERIPERVTAGEA